MCREVRAIILGEKLLFFFFLFFQTSSFFDRFIPRSREKCKGCQFFFTPSMYRLPILPYIIYIRIFNILFSKNVEILQRPCRFSTSFTFDREARARARSNEYRKSIYTHILYTHTYIHARIYRKNKRREGRKEDEEGEGKNGAGIEAVCSPGILANYRRQRSQFENQCHPPPRDRRYGVTSVHTEAIPWNGIA